MTGVAHAVGLDPVLAVALLGLVLLAAAGLGAVMMRRRKGEA